MKNIIERIVGGAKIARYLPKAVSTRLAVAALAALAAGGAWAATDKTNPVTGENQSYTYNYTGSGAWTASDWSPTPSNVPQASGSDVWDSLLIDGNLTVTAPSHVEGWSFRIGLFGDAKLTVPYIRYWNGTAYAVVDEGSKLTIQTINTQDNWAATVNYYVAAAGGVTYECAFNPTVTAAAIYNYNLKGAGSVVYENAVSSGSHVIKQADVTLSGNATPSVESKPLVSFGSGTTKAFTADAAIKVYGTDGTTLVETVNLAEVKTAPTLTADDPVGSCELVQTSTGIVLKYVDGDPADVVAKTYTPSININFCHGNAPLTTAADVGYGDYAVPGTSWNNMVSAGGNNGTFTTPLSPIYGIDSTGAQKEISGASVAVSGTRGSWSCPNLAVASDLRNGYVDESSSGTTPTVTVSGIPYDQYKVVVYTATDAANVAFGYVTINGTDYTYANGAVTEGTTAWGASGAQDTAEALAEGVNVLVSPVVSGATLTVVGHRSGTNPRGCIAAVQIVKVEQQVGENDLLIELDGDRTYTFDEAKAYGGTVYVLGEGTLTFDGAASTAETLHIGPAAAVNMVGSSLTPTAVTGNGTVVYVGAQPSTTIGFSDAANWQGTVWVKNVGSGGETSNTTVTLGSDTSTAASNTINNWGNANSRVKFTNVRGHVSACNCAWTLVLEDDGDTKAWYNNNGWTGSSKDPVFAKLAGDGTFYDTYNDGCRQNVTFTDASEFTGTFNVGAKRIGIGGTNTADNNQDYRGTIEIVSGAVATIASGKTWTSAKGFRVNGTLNVDGTLSCSASTAVSGSGTVVFTGRAPTPTGDSWWKNASWTGTVQMKDVTNLVGGTNWTGTNFLPVEYGNTGSVLELYNCSGWLPNNSNYQCTVPLKITGTLTINNGISGSKFVISSLSGSGTIYTSNNSATTTLQVLEASGFTGKVQLNSKRVVFGNTLPSEYTGGNIYVGEGFTFTVPNSDVAWYGTGGITLAGELKATSLNNLGGGTTVTTTDTGVFTFINSNNTRDHDGNGGAVSDYARITGTGTLRYADVSGKWRSLARTNFPTGMICENNLSAGLILTGTSDNTIGSLSGSGVMRSDWGGSANDNGRPVTILQAKDTVYSGVFHSDDRISTVTVAAGATTSGTLTLSGTQTVSNGLNVQAGVNLIGTWKGDTTVSGTFGGTGTLTGNLTFSDGATFKAFASDENGLAVRGYVEFPATDGEPVTVDLSGITLSGSGTTLITTTGGIINDISKLSVSGAVLALESSNTVLKAYPIASITIGGEATVCESLADAQTKAIQSMPPYGTTPYDYITVYQNSTLDSFMLDGLKIKKAFNDIVVTINAPSAEYAVAQSDDDEDGIFICTLANEPTIYTWTDNYNAPDPQTGEYMVADHRWTSPGNWSFGSGTTATRAPVAGDTVVFNDGATVTLDANAACAAMTVNGAVSISGAYNLAVSGNITGGTGKPVLSLAGVNLSLTASSTVSGISLVLADANATLVVPSGATVPVPTTSVADSYVKATTGESTTVYSVAAKRTATVSVGTNASLSINGNPVADGDTVKFVPGDVLTIAASADTYYTPALTVNSVAQTSPYQLTTTDADVTVFATATRDTVAITIPSVANTTVSVSYTSGGAAQVATTAGDITVDAGTDVTATWTAASGYKITSGASQTLNAVTSAQTLASPTVEAMGATVSDVNFNYGADYATATVTATVTGDATSATLRYGNATYNTNVVNGTVTFENVAVTRGNDIYAATSYTITAKDGETAVTTTGGNGTTVAADVYDGWITEDSSHPEATGDWQTDISYDSDTAVVTDNMYTPTSPSSNDVVTITVKDVVYPELSDESQIITDAQAAICLGTNSASAVVFKVLVTNVTGVAHWEASSFVAQNNFPYEIAMTFDYTKGTYSATVNGSALTAAGATSWGLCKSATNVRSIEFMGSGSIKGIQGTGLEGNVIVDVTGKKYATVDEAVAALEAGTATAPLKKLHDATAPNGWRFDGDTLIKVAKGMFFFAF